MKLLKLFREREREREGERLETSQRTKKSTEFDEMISFDLAGDFPYAHKLYLAVRTEKAHSSHSFNSFIYATNATNATNYSG